MHGCQRSRPNLLSNNLTGITHMNFLKNLHSKIFAGLAGLLFVSLAFGATIYYGYNPNTGLNGLPGLTVAGGPLPTVAGSGGGCGTVPAPVGGSSVFQITTAGVTSCTLTITYTVPSTALAGSSAASPNGIFCVVSDETTPADSVRQTAHTTTTSTVTGTIVAGDNLLIECNGF